MKRSPERTRKLFPKFLGPYLVTSKAHGNKKKVLDPANNISEVVNFEWLKKADAPLPRTASPSSTSFPTLLLHLTLAFTTIARS